MKMLVNRTTVFFAGVCLVLVQELHADDSSADLADLRPINVEEWQFTLAQDTVEPTPMESPSDVAPPRAPGRTGNVRSQLLSPPTRRRRGARRSFARLSRAPDMFGDVFGSLSVSASTGADFVVSDLPLAGGSRRIKAAEHNRALPTDRVYLLHHHFHNAIRTDRAPAMGLPSVISIGSSVDQYTIGFEKSFDCGNWSVEARLPFVDDFELRSASPAVPMTPDFELFGGDVGNLGLVVKRLLYRTENVGVAAGLAINTPTGSDATGALPISLPSVTYRVHNDAVHLQPFLALTAAPSSSFFCHAFGQIDFGLNGNRVDATSSVGAVASGIVDDQTIGYLDIGAGYWLRQDPCADYWTGVAVIAEVHYATALQDADSVPLFGSALEFGNAAGRFDVVNTTVGIHVGITQLTSLRAGGAFPLDEEDNRFFDSEIQASLIRRF